MIEAAIFDVDGTLLDSMPIWMNAAARYLVSIDIEPEPNLGQVLEEMCIHEAVTYIKKKYNITYSEEEINAGIIDTVRDFYYNEAPLKAGVKEFLEELDNRNIPMVIATSSDKSYLGAALKRTGIDKYFEKIFTSDEVGTGKTQPKIYEVAGAYLGKNAEGIYVFEDVLHAVRSAKKAGYKVIALYDELSKDYTDEIKKECDLYLHDFENKEFFWDFVKKQ